jgi:hypothetical protein
MTPFRSAILNFVIQASIVATLAGTFYAGYYLGISNQTSIYTESIKKVFENFECRRKQVE